MRRTVKREGDEMEGSQSRPFRPRMSCPAVASDAGRAFVPVRFALTLLAGVTVGCLLLACFSPIQVSSAESVTDEAGPDETSISVDRVAVLVNDMVITNSELSRDLRWLRYADPRRFENTVIPELIEELIEEKIERILVIQEIMKTQFLIIPKPEVDVRYAFWQKELADRGVVLEDLLASINFSRDEFSLYIWADLTIEKFIQQKFRSQVRLNEDTVLAWLTEHPVEAGISVEEYMDLDPLQQQQLRESIREKLVGIEIGHMYKKRVEELKKTAIIKRMWLGNVLSADQADSVSGPDKNETTPSMTE